MSPRAHGRVIATRSGQVRAGPSRRIARVVLTLAAAALTASTASAALGDARYVAFTPQPGYAPLVEHQAAAPIIVAANEWSGVTRAAGDLRQDIGRVTAVEPTIGRGPKSAPMAILVGTLGHSELIDQLVREGRLDVAPIKGQWESWVRQCIDHPSPGIDRALVIAGSDKRGTIYGIYDLSDQLGVSPWYWWADVTPTRHDSAYVATARFVQGPPAVKYRGIFLNDEAPDLTNWVAEKYGHAPVRRDPPVPPGVANYGHEFYARIFEALLRLRGNYLWPAMWNNAFNEDDPENAHLADDYGIVMGTSHQEPMMRAQKEWDRRYQKTIGSWNYATHPGLVESFWREGIRRNRAFDNLATLGLRGANDTEMAPGGPPANRALLERIVDRQRGILAEEVSPDLTRVPQLWCLYKEVQDYYDVGMRVPDDVTLLWAEDNWGNVRRLPTPAERQRSGGAGVYYHFDYHGGPRSYQWINTNPLPKIWDQMTLAAKYGADRVWIVNVGHFKGYEVPTEFFLNLAWNPARWPAAQLPAFLVDWATREFGPEHADEIADVVAGYAGANGRRKPELLSPQTYSLVNYDEADRVVAGLDDLAQRARRIAATLPADKQDAFYELVLFPTQATALVNRLYVTAARNELYAAQGRASAPSFAAATRDLFQADLRLMDDFNHRLAGGRWDHFMDQAHLGYTTWRDPPRNSLDAIPLVDRTAPTAAGIGVAIEGSNAAWPGAATPPTLPTFDAFNCQGRWIDVFNRGTQPLAFQARTSVPWVTVNPARGTLGPDARLFVSIDWPHAPAGDASAVVTVESGGVSVPVHLTARNRTVDAPGAYVEDAGAIAIEPEHFGQNTPAAAGYWERIPDYGRTFSGMRAEAPAHSGPTQPAVDAPRLDYPVYVFDGGKADVTVVTSPTLNFVPDRPLRYALAFDEEAPQVVTLVPAGYRAQNGNRDWERVVADNARLSHSQHRLTPGAHTLHVWMVDPGVVLQRILIDLGGLRPSYLGPPESRRTPSAAAPSTVPRETRSTAPSARRSTSSS